MDTVSVVIATYNNGPFLREAVASATQQTLPPSEIIVVDDGSTDNTPDICGELPSSVRCVRQPNAGVSAARNRGVRESSGRWIAFLDGDDIWDTKKLEVQMAALHRLPGIRWSCTGCEVMTATGKVIRTNGLEQVCGALFREVGMSVRSFVSQAMTANDIEISGESCRVYVGDVYGLLFYGNMILPPSVVMERELFEKAGGFDESFRWAEETEFFHRVSAYAPVAFVESPLLRVRKGLSGSLSSPQNSLRLNANALESVSRAAMLRGQLSPFELRAYRIGRQRLHIRQAYFHLSFYDGREARHQVRQAWKDGAKVSLFTLFIFLAGFLPRTALRGMHRFKRFLRI